MRSKLIRNMILNKAVLLLKNAQKSELLIELRLKGVDITTRIYLKSAPVYLCKHHNLETNWTTNIVDSGYRFKPKGLLKVFYKDFLQ